MQCAYINFLKRYIFYFLQLHWQYLILVLVNQEGLYIIVMSTVMEQSLNFGTAKIIDIIMSQDSHQ